MNRDSDTIIDIGLIAIAIVGVIAGAVLVARGQSGEGAFAICSTSVGSLAGMARTRKTDSKGGE